MVHLFLSEPTWDDVVDTDSAKMRISLLSKLESFIQSILMTRGRPEARLWLCNTIGGMISVSRSDQCELFMTLLRSEPTKYGLASQLLQMDYGNQLKLIGELVGILITIQNFDNAGNPTRISQWFSSFAASGGGGMEHGKGAKALTQFAFINRDICWEELEWKGKHGQSPAVVATKPHYFLDLDVQRTVENFLEYVPEFWSSNEFAESLKDGEILSIDRKFFLEYFIDMMYKGKARDVWEVITEFLKEEPFSYVCQHLLITLEERELCQFLELLRGFLHPNVESKHFSNSSFFFEVILSKYSDCGSFDQILLLDAVLTRKHELLRLLRDEGGEEVEEQIKDIVSQIYAIPDHDTSLAPIIKGCFKLKTAESVKWLGLQSWVLYYKILDGYRTIESWESLFMNNAISFRRSSMYSLLNHDGLSEESGSDLEHRVSKKVKHRKRSRKKKKRKLDREHGNEFLDFDTTNEGLGLQSDGGSWMLSIDGYCTSWSRVSLFMQTIRSLYIQYCITFCFRTS
ncbi:hypothetical protein L484_006347 [Morus notabilis]|uniref:Uncharacterized protein n=1 Tax=Morus notabilis TaxID=981085 RepID=W9QPS7_9ROSA|nr:hypothetical protein L484_006347 [Morus notabilis]